MNDYKVKDGVVLECIAGVYLLISTFALRSECPYVKKINETAAFYFEQIKNGHTKSEIIDQVTKAFSDIERKELEQDFDEFINELFQSGYLIKCSGL